MSLINYKNFFPKKVYHCPCLTYVINQIYDADIRSYTEILLAISNYSQGGQVFTLKDKTNCLIMCQAHIIITMLSKVKYGCIHKVKKICYLKACKNAIVNHVSDITATICVVHVHLQFLFNLLYFLVASFSIKKCSKNSKCVIVFWILLFIVCMQILILTNFKKECLRLKGQNDIFTVEETGRNSMSLSPVLLVVKSLSFSN